MDLGRYFPLELRESWVGTLSRVLRFADTTRAFLVLSACQNRSAEFHS